MSSNSAVKSGLYFSIPFDSGLKYLNNLINIFTLEFLHLSVHLRVHGKSSTNIPLKKTPIEKHQKKYHDLQPKRVKKELYRQLFHQLGIITGESTK